MSITKEAAARATANPGVLQELEDAGAFEEAMVGASKLVGLDRADMAGFVVIGARKDGALMIGGNVGTPGKPESADGVAAFLLRAAMQTAPELITSMMLAAVLESMAEKGASEGTDQDDQD